MIVRKFLASAAISAGKGVKVTTATADTVKVATADTTDDRVIGIAKAAIASGAYGYVVLEGLVLADVGGETVAAGDPLTDGTTTSFGKAASLNYGTILGTKNASNLAYVYLEVGASKSS